MGLFRTKPKMLELTLDITSPETTKEGWDEWVASLPPASEIQGNSYFIAKTEYDEEDRTMELPALRTTLTFTWEA